MSLDARLEKLNARIEALRTSRQQLKAQRARKREHHQSTATDDAKMQAMTLAQLRAELGLERQKLRSIAPANGRDRAKVRKRAEAIAGAIEQRQSGNP